jgi:transmembrane sensor
MRFAMAACVVGLLLLLGGAVTLFFPNRAQVYSTAVGEQRSFPLEDGSLIELNSRSRVRVRFTAQARTIELLSGQALFRVAPEPGRPFVVRSGSLRAKAVGTLFDVNRKRAGTVVTVVEGRVAVADLAERAGNSARAEGSAGDGPPRSAAASGAIPAPKDEVLLTAGQQVVVSPPAVLRPATADVAAATAWTQRQLVFEDVPLEEVVEDFNRYSPRPLVVHSTVADELRLSGIFSTDPAFFLRFLRERPDITVQETDTEVLIVHHEPRAP